MAVNRAHALTTTVGTFSGIQIDMGLLRALTIRPDGQSAWFQGGSYGGAGHRHPLGPRLRGE